MPDDVLRKPGPLTTVEYDTIKQHTVLGARILRTVPFLSRHVAIVELHHERPDGRGYPHGLIGDDIPLAARIVHVADAYDAMTNARAYRPGRPSADALRELWTCAGTEFHAEVVGALATALPSLRPSMLPDPVLEVAVCVGGRSRGSSDACCSPPARVRAIGRARQRRQRRQHQPSSRVRTRPINPTSSSTSQRRCGFGKGWIGIRAAVVPAAVDGSRTKSRRRFTRPRCSIRRAGRIATRVDLGYILSPIGLGMLDMRPDTNPMIMTHLSYLVPMPSFDAGVPAALPIASSYPLGGQLTASTTKWDARAAVVASPPNRSYVLYASSPNPEPHPT